MQTQKIPRFASALLLLTLGLAASSEAQTPTPASPAAEAPVVQLDPFIVNVAADQGYIATDSLAGGRNAMPVTITPSTLSSLTEAFIDDLQLTDVRSALQWTPNIVPVSWNGGHDGGGDVFNSWAYNIRGAGTGPQGGNPPTVNYFPFYGVKDLYNVDRLEVDRGPNSILFGVGNLGGSLSTYTKVPQLNKDFENLDVVANSFGGVRVTADVNQVTDGGKLGVRVDLLGDRDQEWRKDDLTKKWGASLATSWKVTDSTTVRLDLEAFKQETPQFAVNLTDNYSQWDGKTNSPTWGAEPTGGTAATNSMAEWGGPTSTLVWIPSAGSLMNWGPGYRGAGLGDGPYYYNAVMRPYSYELGTSGLDVPALPSRDFTVGPSDGLFTWEYYTATLYLDQKINANSEFEIAAYRYSDKGTAKNFESPGNVDVDINKQMPDGSANPNYGQLYSDMFLDKQIQDHSSNEFRAQYNYHFDTNLWGVPVNEWLSASLGEEFHLLTTRQYIATDMNGYNPNTWTENMIWAREYYNQPNTAISLPSSINGSPIVYLPLPFNWFDHDLTEQIKYGGIVSQTRLWNDRVNLTLGARDDRYWSELVNVRGTNNIPAIESDSGTTYSAGFVGYITKWFGVDYNYSSNFAPIGGGVAPSLTGGQFGPATGKSNTIGIRISTEDHKYYISADYYADKAHGRITNDSVDLQGIWNYYFQAGGTATDIGPAGTVTGLASNGTLHANMSWADTEDVKDTGFEMEAVANPTPNWRFQVTLAVPKSVSTNDLPGARQYYDAHLAEWSPLVTTGTQPYAGSLNQDLTNTETTLNNVAGSKTSAGLVKSTFSVFTVYTFTDTWARGLAIGGGATALGAQNISTGGSLSSPGYQIYSALVSYSTRLGKVPAKFQLNVDNLFGNKTLVYTGYNTFSNGGTQGSNFNYLTPRKLTLSMRLEF